VKGIDMPNDSKVADNLRDEMSALTALRDRLAVEVDECRSRRDLAALSRQFMLVVGRLSELQKPVGSRIDEIAKRRARRQAAVGRAKKPG
jgi:hypothetical protein